MTTKKKSFAPTLLLLAVVLAIGAGIGWRAINLSEDVTALESERSSIASAPSFRLDYQYDPVLDARRSRLDSEISDARREAEDWMMGFIIYASIAAVVAFLRWVIVPSLNERYERMMQEHEAKNETQGIDPHALGRSVKSGLAAAATTINRAIPRQPTTGRGRLSTADELRKWSDLRDEGLVTEEEFQKMRDKLVG